MHEHRSAEGAETGQAPQTLSPLPPITAEEIRRTLDALVKAARAEGDDGAVTDWAALYASFDTLESRVQSEGSRRRFRWTQDTRDTDAEERLRQYREELLPAFEDGASVFLRLLLESKDRARLDEAYRPQLLRLLAVENSGLDPVNADLRLRQRRLINRYDKKVAHAEVQVRGGGMSLARARSKTSSADPALRREAWLAWRGWYRDEHQDLAATFDELVTVRQRMAERVGDDNYVPLGYAGMGRTDFGPAESQAFRDAVESYAVPLLKDLRTAQARHLGTPSLRPWDVGFHPAVSLADGAASPVSSQLDNAQKLFDRLEPRLAERFRYMRDHGLIDLENRPGKGAGAYCTAFHDEGKVLIFCNSVGDEGDIRTLTHEMGHAFQCWESQWIQPVRLRWPTMDAAEVHSMGMEYLALRHADAFFSSVDARKFRLGRWRRGVELLCYVACVDAFQHWVYAHPEATPEDRDATWVSLQARFDAGVDWSGEAAPFAATRWYAQLHIFRYPFYYIDYALAELGAMQLAQAASQNKEAALNCYLDLCHLGGTQSMLGLLFDVGLDSPFEEALMERLMAYARGKLAVAL